MTVFFGGGGGDWIPGAVLSLESCSRFHKDSVSFLPPADSVYHGTKPAIVFSAGQDWNILKSCVIPTEFFIEEHDPDLQIFIIIYSDPLA